MLKRRCCTRSAKDRPKLSEFLSNTRTSSLQKREISAISMTLFSELRKKSILTWRHAFGTRFSMQQPRDYTDVFVEKLRHRKASLDFVHVQWLRHETKLRFVKKIKVKVECLSSASKPAYMALSSPDPIMTTFELRQEMKKLAQVEKEFKVSFCLSTPQNLWMYIDLYRLCMIVCIFI